MPLPPTGVERNRSIILGLAFARAAVQEWRDLSPENRQLALDSLDAQMIEVATLMALIEEGRTYSDPLEMHYA